MCESGRITGYDPLPREGLLRSDGVAGTRNAGHRSALLPAILERLMIHTLCVGPGTKDEEARLTAKGEESNDRIHSAKHAFGAGMAI